MSETRTYKSPLREEQMAQTRERILEKVTEILASPGVELTVAEAATRARVSVRTAYRYFPTKDALLDAFHEYASKQMGFAPMPKTLDELASYAGVLARTFAANESMMRANQRALVVDEVRVRRKMNQARAVQKLVDEGVPGVSPAIRKQAAASLLTAMGFDAWAQLRDIWHLPPEEAIATMEWNAAAILAQLYKAAGKKR